MAQSKLDELKLDLAELTKLSNLAERPRIKAAFSIEIRKLETEIVNVQELVRSSKDAEPKKVVAANQNRCYDVSLTNYAWDQSDKFVKIFITIKNVHTLPEENVHCDFETKSLKMTVKNLENRNYSFSMKDLLENIDVAASKWKVKKDMVVIFLSKSNSNKWSHLTAIEKKTKEPKKSLADMDSNEDPTGRLMDMMRQMYEEGDDDMKRTIAQSWTENAAKSRVGL